MTAVEGVCTLIIKFWGDAQKPARRTELKPQRERKGVLGQGQHKREVWGQCQSTGESGWDGIFMETREDNLLAQHAPRKFYSLDTPSTTDLSLMPDEFIPSLSTQLSFRT